MRAATTLSLAVASALALSCSKAENAFEVLVNVGSGATANCMNVAVWGQPSAQLLSNNFPNTGPGPYKVAVYQGKLPDSVSVEAFGYGDSACTALASQSGPSPAVFGQTSSLGLTLFPLSVTDAGSDGGGGPDGGPGDSGHADAGNVDAGGPPDAGAPDAGVFDAGPDCAAKTWPGGYTPSNFDLANVPCVNASMLVDCNATVDTTGFPATGNLNICGRLLTAALVNQPNGTNPVQVVVIASASLNVVPDAGATFQGPYPVILAVYGVGQVDGILSASAGADAGPAADHDSACNAVAGTGKGGGGGGGFGANGGNGGGNGGSQGKQVGANMNPLSPREGGCTGASGDPAGGGLGGGGGGALQISASGNLVITGTIACSGAGGGGGGNGLGGGGGGSGGALLLEANRVSLDLLAGQRAGALTVNGGGGGGGGFPGGNGSPGKPGNAGTNTSASGGPGGGTAGAGGNGGAQMMAQDGSPPSNNGGGGGGGGSVGYIRVNAANSCNLSSGTVRSGNYSSNGGTGCN
jgi:hypothetical protein